MPLKNGERGKVGGYSPSGALKFETSAGESIAHYLGRIAASGCSGAGSSTSNSGT